jgi:hypothetical protein
MLQTGHTASRCRNSWYWVPSQIQFEVPVQGYDPTPWNGFTDFCLYHPDGSVLAVIEAKRTARVLTKRADPVDHTETGHRMPQNAVTSGGSSIEGNDFKVGWKPNLRSNCARHFGTLQTQRKGIVIATILTVANCFP